MEAKELRVGNFITGDNGEPLPVEYIHMDVIGLKNKAGGTDKYQKNPIVSGNIIDLKPIPLTEDWLVRFGFDKYTDTNPAIENQLIYRKNKFAVELRDWKFNVPGSKSSITVPKDMTTKKIWTLIWYDADDDWGIATSVRINYVHQLQNLYFALTGTELTLK